MSKKHNSHVPVFIVVWDEHGRILLHQRAGTDWLPGYWDFPSGHVEPGESFAQAAARELSEETSLSVRQQDLAGRTYHYRTTQVQRHGIFCPTRLTRKTNVGGTQF